VLGIWLFDDVVTPMALLGVLLIVGAGIVATMLRARGTPPAPSPVDS
jgi:drug/metabolite transporter (DMT)-like permease